MRLDPFKLERYLAQYEFTAPHQLSCSDCDGIEMSELLALADGESRQLWESLALGYTEAPGHPLLRSEIAGMYSGAGADDVLVAAPEELIFLAVNSIVRNGDHVVCTFPAYQSLYQIAEGMHCEVTFWQADEKQGWRFEPARLAEMIRPSTRLIVVNFPHNPTGALPSRDDFDAVVEIARRHNLTLLCDEMYRLLEYDEAARLPAAVEVYERAVSLSGMSKVYGLAGARVGWVVSRDARLLKRMLTLKDYTTICTSAPSEILSLMALRARGPIVERHMTRIRRNLAALSAFIAKYPNLFAWNPPRGRDRLSAARPPRDAARRGALRGGRHRGRCGPRAVVDVRLRRPSRALRPRPGGLHRSAGRVRRLPGIEDRRRGDGRRRGRAGRAHRRSRRPNQRRTCHAAAGRRAHRVRGRGRADRGAVVGRAGEAPPVAADPSLYFPASAREAHAEHDAVAEDTAPPHRPHAPQTRALPTIGRAGVRRRRGRARAGCAGSSSGCGARSGASPRLLRRTRMRRPTARSGAGEPSEIEVVSPGDIAPEAVFAKPSVAAEDDQTPDREPPAPPPDQAAGAESPAAAPAAPEAPVAREASAAPETSAAPEAPVARSPSELLPPSRPQRSLRPPSPRRARRSRSSRRRARGGPSRPPTARPAPSAVGRTAGVEAPVSEISTVRERSSAWHVASRCARPRNRGSHGPTPGRGEPSRRS